MATTYSPTAPVVGDDVTLTTQLEIAVGESTRDTDTEHVRYVLESVPPDSALVAGILVDSLGAETDTFTPDVPGAYAFTAHVSYEYAAPPCFDGADNGATYQVLVTSFSKTVRVGATMDLPFALPDGRGLTLRLVVHNATITTASLVSPLTREDELAALDSAVVAALEDLIGVAVSGIGPDLPTVVSELITQYNAHRVEGGGVHANDDATNVYVPSAPYDQSNAVQQLNTFVGVFFRHLTQASTASLPWHTADDTLNVPITGNASTVAQAMLVYADMVRCYGRHIEQTVTPASHGVADSSNVIVTSYALTALLGELLYIWAAAAPTAPTGAEAGEYQLQSRYGFRAVS